MSADTHCMQNDMCTCFIPACFPTQAVITLLRVYEATLAVRAKFLRDAVNGMYVALS